MKLVIIGASGNVGTALLKAVGDSSDITEVTAIARRVPRRTPSPPYDVATWKAIDIGETGADAVVASLAQAMEGADAVIHLAWIIQPNHNREMLRRVNVHGAARVLAAARMAEVPHLVVASSVSAYSRAEDDELRDESWDTEGISSSEYSVDKAAVEKLLDDHVRNYPQMLITRLRPALIFQRAVGAQVMRNFMAPLVPQAAFGGRLPIAPVPARAKIQAVHADDVAQAYLAAVRAGVGGAFNIAASDIIGVEELAQLLDHGRALEVPPKVLRAMMWAAWQSRVLAASPGWMDLADMSPLMDTTKAQSVLGWTPQRSGYDTLAELLDGMANGDGAPSPPLRPRDYAPSTRPSSSARVPEVAA